jgi:predicted ATPase
MVGRQDSNLTSERTFEALSRILADNPRRVMYLAHELDSWVRGASGKTTIEEPETDLHPRALHGLLDLIVQSAAEHNNQFVISTHSNIVVRHLGGLDDRIITRSSASRRPNQPLA